MQNEPPAQNGEQSLTIFGNDHARTAGRTQCVHVTGILMIIGAALSILFGVIIGGVGALIAKFAGASTLGFAFYLGLATTLVGGIIQLIAGINGVKHCNKPENAKKCITWGIIVIALAVISNVLEVIGGGKFNVLSFVIGLIVPGLYIYGAFLNHKENAR